MRVTKQHGTMDMRDPQNVAARAPSPNEHPIKYPGVPGLTNNEVAVLKMAKRRRDGEGFTTATAMSVVCNGAKVAERTRHAVAAATIRTLTDRGLVSPERGDETMHRFVLTGAGLGFAARLLDDAAAAKAQFNQPETKE